jgi:cytochrome b
MHASHLAAATATVALSLPSTYGYVLLVAVLMGLQILLWGFIFSGGARKKAFTQEFMKDNFGQVHR